MAMPAQPSLYQINPRVRLTGSAARAIGRAQGFSLAKAGEGKSPGL
jgi:hypothetical protein